MEDTNTSIKTVENLKLVIVVKFDKLIFDLLSSHPYLQVGGMIMVNLFRLNSNLDIWTLTSNIKELAEIFF